MKTQFSQRDVRDPRRLASALEGNFKAVEEQLPENVAVTITGMIKATAGKVSKAVAGDDYLAPPAALPAANEEAVILVDDAGNATADTEGITTDGDVIIDLGDDKTLTIAVKAGLITKLEFDDGEA